MKMMLTGLLLFLGVHSVRMVAPDWRDRMRGRLGPAVWKGLYSLVSLLGLALVAWGFDLARDAPSLVWQPPVSARFLVAPLSLLAFVLLAAAYVPGNAIKARWHHPMALGVALLALAHLPVAGLLAQALLFSSFLVWAVASYAVAKRRERRAGVTYAAGGKGATVVCVGLGLAAWGVFALGLHGVLIGVKPFG